MPFKRVETIENGNRVITTIPEQWEDEGILYWPRQNAAVLK